MALNLAQSLQEARSIPTFNGTSEYTIINFMRDVSSIISLTPEEYHQVIKTTLANKIQGKALNAINTLENPTFEDIITKLREEFGEKRTYFALREEALQVKATNIKELHYKLEKILDKMNNKYRIEENRDEDYNPSNNERIIFNIYINSLPPYIKVILIQNNINRIKEAHNFLIQNDLMKDIVLKNQEVNYPNKNWNLGKNNENKNGNNYRQRFNYTQNWQQNEQTSGNFTRQTRNRNYQDNRNLQNYQNNPNNRNFRNDLNNQNYQGNQSYQNNRNFLNYQSRNNNSQHTRYVNNRAEPMEIDMVQTENFCQPCLDPNFP